MALQVHEVEACDIPEPGDLVRARPATLAQPRLDVVELRCHMDGHPLVPAGPVLRKGLVGGAGPARIFHSTKPYGPFKDRP